MKKLIYLFLGLTIFQSCGSDSETPKEVLFLTGMEDDIRNEVWDFDYNTDSTVNEITFTYGSSIETWQFEYNETTKAIENITVIEDDGENETTYTLELMYNTVGNLEVINEWREESKYSTLQYTYGSNGKIQTLTLNYIDWEQTSEATLTWQGDNLASYESDGMTHKFTYDNKPNHIAKMKFYIPYAPIHRGYSSGNLSSKSLELLSKNNCTFVTIDYGDEWTEEQSTHWVYYNSYPTTSRVVAGDTLNSRKIYVYSESLP